MALVDNAWYVNYGNGSSTGYYAVTPWAALTTKVCGNLIRQLAAPAVGSERVFVCTKSTAGTGVTSAAEVTWTVTRGAITADTGTLNWQECTGIAAFNGDFSANTPLWSNASIKNSAITLGQVITNVAGTIVLICTVAGTAGNGAEPTWAAYTTAGATTADNTVTWTNIGVVGNFTIWNAPHARIANAFVTNWGQAGNNFYISSIHAETQSTALTGISALSTAAAPNFIYCVKNAPATTPPGTADLAITATISTTGNSSLSFNGVRWYMYGVTLSAGSGANAPNMNIGGLNTSQVYLEACTLILGGTTGGIIQCGNTLNCHTTLLNTTVKFSSTSSGMSISQGIWKNTASAIGGSTFPTSLFSGAPANPYVVIDGVDLSAITGTLFGSSNVANRYIVRNCKLAGGVTLVGSSGFSLPRYDFIACDSAGTNYLTARYW